MCSSTNVISSQIMSFGVQISVPRWQHCYLYIYCHVCYSLYKTWRRWIFQQKSMLGSWDNRNESWEEHLSHLNFLEMVYEIRWRARTVLVFWCQLKQCGLTQITLSEQKVSSISGHTVKSLPGSLNANTITRPNCDVWRYQNQCLLCFFVGLCFKP